MSAPLTEARDAGLRAGTRFRLTGHPSDGREEIKLIARRHGLGFRERNEAAYAWSEAYDESSHPKYRDGSGSKGRKPYGHYADESACLVRMLELRDDERLSWSVIADTLNAEHHRRRNGTEWTDVSAAGIYRKAVSRSEV